MKTIKASLLATGVILLGGLLGCGADPAPDLFDDGFGREILPVGGILDEIEAGYQSIRNGQFTSAREKFTNLLTAQPTDAQASMIWTGIGYIDIRQLGTAEGQSELKRAHDLDPTNEDARVLYAGILISRGEPADIDQAVDLLKGIDPPKNPDFPYADRFNLGISKAEVHALLAYALKLDGQDETSEIHRTIAEREDADVNDTTVDQILSVLEFLP